MKAAAELAGQVGVKPACDALGVCGATFYRRLRPMTGHQQPSPTPARALSEKEQDEVGGRVFVFGGYTVAEDGSEKSMPDVAVYEPTRDAWSRGADMPLPVDDAVSGVWEHSLIYLVSGWHDTGNVAEVQIFDAAANMWTRATPILGKPVFGHSGSIVGDDIIYLGGSKIVEGQPRFVVDRAAWRGRIDGADPTHITWEPVPHLPGAPLYRAAGATLGGLVVLAGGTDNPYNYNGIGYDGAPSSPSRQLLAYDGRAGWVSLPAPPVATMDHRTLGVAGGYVFLVGGMVDGQRVSDRVWYAEVDALLEGRTPAR